MIMISGTRNSVFRPEWSFSDQSNGYIEKRRLFLQSYHFSRKKSASEKVRCSAVRVRKLVWIRLRATRRLPRVLWQRLRVFWNRYGRRRSFRFYRHEPIFNPYRPIICSSDWSC